MTQIEATVYELVGRIVGEFPIDTLTVNLLDAPAGRLTVTGRLPDGTPDTKSFTVTQDARGELAITMDPPS